MFDYTAIKDIRALVWCDSRLWMDSEMQSIKVVNIFTQTLTHRSQEATQGVSLVTAANLCNSAILNGKSNRFT